MRSKPPRCSSGVGGAADPADADLSPPADEEEEEEDEEEEEEEDEEEEEEEEEEGGGLLSALLLSMSTMSNTSFSILRKREKKFSIVSYTVSSPQVTGHSVQVTVRSQG